MAMHNNGTANWRMIKLHSIIVCEMQISVPFLCGNRRGTDRSRIPFLWLEVEPLIGRLKVRRSYFARRPLPFLVLLST